MNGKTQNVIRICLEGDWTMSGVAQQFPLIKQWFTQLTATDEEPVATELDLIGITELDACGCQLLASFVLNLQLRGITPFCAGIPEAFSAKIRFLGFDRVLGSLFGVSQVCL